MEVSSTQDFTITKDHRKMNKKRESNGDDLISDLPDEVLHQILSFLDMRYVVKTSFLSRRWRNLWKTLPFLNFNEEIFIGSTVHLCYKDFDDFVIKVLSLQNGTNIHTFRLILEDPHQNTSIDTWMPVLVRRNIQVLDIHNSYRSPLELPPCIVTCKSLTMLKLDMGELQNSVGSWELPDSMSNCMLLEYNDVTLLTISAPQLKNFELDHLYLGDPFNPPYPVSSKVKVCAPNLTWPRYKDFTLNVKFSENISYLVKAEISKGLYLQIPEVLEDEIESVIQCFRQFYCKIADSGRVVD